MLKPSEKRPTVKRLPRFVRHSPTTSSPPVEQPQVKAKPRAKPHRMPPTRHEARGSSKIGTADGKLKPCLHSDAEIALRGLSGEELEQAIRRGILMKPERHHMDETGVTETHRGMFAIGG